MDKEKFEKEFYRILDSAPPEAREQFAALDTLCGFLTAVNEDKAGKARAFLTPDAAIVDVVPPFRWTGVKACDQWLAALRADSGAMPRALLAFKADFEIQVDDRRAHLTAAIVPTADQHEQIAPPILLTLALRKGPSRWLIESATWSPTLGTTFSGGMLQ